MKIGIMTYRQTPYISANTAIAYIIGEQLSKKNEIIFIGRKQDECQTSIDSYHGNKILYINKKPLSDSPRVKNYLIKMGLIRIAFFKDGYSLNKIIRNESIDALICVIAPNEDAFISLSVGLKIPVYLYQLDPFYNLHDVENKRLKKVFTQYIKKVKHLFTTALLMNSYKEDKDMKRYLNKMSVVQFPKLVKPKFYNIIKENRIRLLYSGSLYADRKPDFLIELNRCIPQNCEIVFCGKCEKQEDTQRLEKSGILCRGYCSQDVLDKEMNRADIFLNIGNIVMNQMPSKVIDYIATGKPIINLSQIEQCSSRKVLKEYKYYLDVNVKAIKQHKDQICAFILQNKDNRILWDEVYSQYKEYTPEFVAERILQQIEIDNGVKEYN